MGSLLHRLLLFVIALSWLCLTCQASDGVREEVERSKDYPWFDVERGKLAPVGELKPQEDAAGRKSTWESDGMDFDWDWGSAPNMGGFGAAFWEVLSVVFMIFLGAILIGLVLLLVWAFTNVQESAGLDDGYDGDLVSDATRVENLPFEVDPSKVDLLAEARLAYSNGEYDKAIVYFYSHLLVQLDRRHFIQLEKGKTNRQYLNEVRQWANIKGILGQTMFVFEDVFFGKRNLQKERFESCWNRLSEFEQIVSGGK